MGDYLTTKQNKMNKQTRNADFTVAVVLVGIGVQGVWCGGGC